MNASTLAMLTSVVAPAKGLRPLPVRQPTILPFDPDADGCEIHTALPPEAIIPNRYDINFVRHDAWGVTLTETPPGPPAIPGSNTTPYEMIMAYQLPYYRNYDLAYGTHWVDTILVAHAERNLSHFLLDRRTWLDAGWSDAQAIDLMAYLVSWGFYVPFWAMGTLSWGARRLTLNEMQGLHRAGLRVGESLKYSAPTRGGIVWSDIEAWAVPLMNGLITRQLADQIMWVVGEELNSYVEYGDDGLDDIVRHLCAMANPVGMPVVLHFTSNYPGCYGADTGNEITWYQKLVEMGLWGTFWQADHYDSAALMGAHLWDTRKYMAVDNRLHCCAFELRGMPQLYGECDETGGARTGWEMLCTPVAPNVPTANGVAGGAAARYPSGVPL
jgi:hypothetical protein